MFSFSYADVQKQLLNQPKEYVEDELDPIVKHLIDLQKYRQKAEQLVLLTSDSNKLIEESDEQDFLNSLPPVPKIPKLSARKRNADEVSQLESENSIKRKRTFNEIELPEEEIKKLISKAVARILFIRGYTDVPSTLLQHLSCILEEYIKSLISDSLKITLIKDQISVESFGEALRDNGLKGIEELYIYYLEHIKHFHSHLICSCKKLNHKLQQIFGKHTKREKEIEHPITSVVSEISNSLIMSEYGKLEENMDKIKQTSSFGSEESAEVMFLKQELRKAIFENSFKDKTKMNTLSNNSVVSASISNHHKIKSAEKNIEIKSNILSQNSELRNKIESSNVTALSSEFNANKNSIQHNNFLTKAKFNDGTKILELKEPNIIKGASLNKITDENLRNQIYKKFICAEKYKKDLCIKTVSNLKSKHEKNLMNNEECIISESNEFKEMKKPIEPMHENLRFDSVSNEKLKDNFEISCKPETIHVKLNPFQAFQLQEKIKSSPTRALSDSIQRRYSFENTINLKSDKLSDTTEIFGNHVFNNDTEIDVKSNPLNSFSQTNEFFCNSLQKYNKTHKQEHNSEVDDCHLVLDKDISICNTDCLKNDKLTNDFDNATSYMENDNHLLSGNVKHLSDNESFLPKCTSKRKLTNVYLTKKKRWALHLKNKKNYCSTANKLPCVPIRKRSNKKPLKINFQGLFSS